MIRDHLSESEIQQYASGETTADMVTARHIESCKNCNTRLVNYRLLFSAVEQQPRPAFDFDTANLIIARLPAPVQVNREEKFLKYAVIIMGAVIVVVPIYIFRKLFINMAGSITSFSLYTIAASGILVLLLKVFGLYKNYQKQITALNLN